MADEKGGVSVTFDVVGIDEVLAHIPNAVARRAMERRLVERVSLIFEWSLKTAYDSSGITRRTGASRNSIAAHPPFETPEGWAAKVGGADTQARTYGSGLATASGSRVAYWLDRGTGIYGPHKQMIHPTTKPFMVWRTGTMGAGGNLRLTGQARFGKAGATAGWLRVRATKGMRPRPFFNHGYETAQPQIAAFLETAARKFTEIDAERNL
jgi:hypothetical protein